MDLCCACSTAFQLQYSRGGRARHAATVQMPTAQPHVLDIITPLHDAAIVEVLILLIL
jgi:hypothetical protein